MNFHTTAANFASQNVLPQSQQVVGVSSPTGYSTMLQDPHFCDSYQSQFQLIPPFPPIYPGPPVFADQYAFGDDESVQHPGLYHFSNLHLQLDHSNPPYEQNHSGQMRRYSLGEMSISRSTSIAPNPSVKLAQMYEEVSRYFDSDPCKRETIHNGGMISGLEKRFGTVTAEFKPPSFGKQELRKLKLVLVKFKAGRLDVYYIHRDSKEFSRLRIDDLVIVEADRGSDLGKVAQIDISYDESRRLKMHNTLEKKCFFIGRGNYRQGGSQSQGFKTKGKNVHLQLDAPKAISSLANSKDTEAIYRKIRDEEKACQITINVISSMLFLGLRIQRGNEPTKFEGEDIGQMEIVDAEYQFDRKKLTIYFTSPKRVNFRDLLTELFKLFKARIWFEPVQSRSIPFRCLPHASNDSSDLTTFHVRSKSCESRKNLTSKNNGWRLSPRREAERRDWDFQQSPRFGCVEPNSSRMPKQRYSSKSQDAQVKASLDFLRQQNDFSASLPNAKRYGSNARISDKRCIG
ncbi:hypothetical protein METBIDRAFT_12636 [Metschnikowia bicuspidata var. bicuspidata NRRL YB-4993]|uniref:PSP1 C-terminal domain-containing protein n=1 Tax=Metschnikowia bicuspidata var. bicuspidata NRRL YB-4993 TaxID=869754 RepID=A0A1A0H9I4_9ASCO|nr:hypothetical protein METBIDRAFT_12636 [Metschnikowia bicuspidata var. bicuspidata NRRL YB-4993]OBA20676.1 hypothetical protein METBIDRAFT_12636 [Metschnikowia bicuspidata var. bicuspidata NRRL YB-4993]